MALRMVALNRAEDGRWLARKGIPADVRVDYQRLYGTKREAQLKLPANTPKHEAKARLGEWEAEVETRIATLRAQRNGEGQPLTKLNAIALAGRWYSWFVKQHEDDPGPAKRWREAADYFVWEVLREEAPDSYEEDPSSDPHCDWEKAPEVREAVRPHVAELARTASFLASEGRALNATAYALFLDAVSDNLLPALSVLERRAKGDYSRDDTPDTFPTFNAGPLRAEASVAGSCSTPTFTRLSPRPTRLRAGVLSSLPCNSSSLRWALMRSQRTKPERGYTVRLRRSAKQAPCVRYGCPRLVRSSPGHAFTSASAKIRSRK